MRDFKGMKRQRSRNRNGGGGGGGSGGGGGGGKPQHNANRAFDSNGPEGVKVRGAAQHVYEKYQQLARDAHTVGDRVLAENYQQHAEHYFRVMRAMQPQRPLSEIIGRDQFVSGYDIDFEDENGQSDVVEAEAEADSTESADAGGERQPRFEGRRDDYRQPETRSGSEQPRTDRYQNDRSDRYQSDRSQTERSQTERPAQVERPASDRTQSERVQSDRQRDDRPAVRAAREDRPRFNRDDRPARTERSERGDRDPLSVIEPEATPLTPPPVAVVAPAPMLRAEDGDSSHAPAFLQVRPIETRAEGGEEVRRPRRRKAPATFAASEAAPSASAVEES
jgi:hypothetical protein